MKHFSIVLLVLAFFGLLSLVKYASKHQIGYVKPVKVTEITLDYVPVITEYK